MEGSPAPRRARVLGLLGFVLLVSMPGASAGQEESPLDRARAAYEVGEYGKAILELEGALVHSSKYSEHTLADMHLYLGLSYLALGRSERADRAFQQALKLDVKKEVDPALRTPEVEEAFLRARWVVEREAAERSNGEEERVPLGQAIEVAQGPTGKTRWGGVWRSFLVPGWGQIYGERKKRGYLFLAGEVASLVGAAYATVERNDARDKCDDARMTAAANLGTLCDDYDSWRRTRDTFVVVAAGLWALNLLESLLNDPSVAPREMRVMDDWRLGGIGVTPNGWSVRVVRRF